MVTSQLRDIYRGAAFEDGYALAVACLDAGAGQIHHECVHRDEAAVESMAWQPYRSRLGRYFICDVPDIIGLEQGVVFFSYFACCDMKQLAATEGHGYGVAGVTVYPVPVGQYDIDHGAVGDRHDVNCGATCRYRHGIIEEQFPERRRRLHNILVAHHLCRKHIAGTADAHGTHKDEKRDGIRTRNVEASRLWQVADAPRIGAVVDKVFGDKAECVANAAYRVGYFNIIGIGAAQLASHDMKGLRVARQLV